jgi:hypothetical protein
MNNNTIPNDVVEYLSSYYETFGSLPTPTLQCNETGIAVTAFGTNLKKKIEKAGSVEALLTTFVSRSAKAKKSESGNRTPAKVSIKTT